MKGFKVADEVAFRMVHFECDSEARSWPEGDGNYLCPACKREAMPAEFPPQFSASASPSVSTVDEADEAEYLAQFMKTQMAGESLSGTASPFSEFDDLPLDMITEVSSNLPTKLKG